MSDESSVEERVLTAMRGVLIDVIKDTTTKPGMRHPLSDDTLTNIRKCLELITARQSELAGDRGESWNDRPRYIDEPQTSVAVTLDPGGKKDES